MPNEHRANLFVTVEEFNFLQEMVLNRRAYQYTEKCTPDTRNESAFWTTSAPRYEQGLGAAFFAERAAKIAHWRCANLPGIGNFAQASGDVRQSFDYPEGLSQKLLGNFLQFKHSAFPREHELQGESNRALWSCIISLGGEQHDKSDRDAGRALYAPTQNLVMENLESDGSRMWAAQTGAALHFWPG